MIQRMTCNECFDNFNAVAVRRLSHVGAVYKATLTTIQGFVVYDITNRDSTKSGYYSILSTNYPFMLLFSMLLGYAFHKTAYIH